MLYNLITPKPHSILEISVVFNTKKKLIVEMKLKMIVTSNKIKTQLTDIKVQQY